MFGGLAEAEAGQLIPVIEGEPANRFGLGFGVLAQSPSDGLSNEELFLIRPLQAVAE